MPNKKQAELEHLNEVSGPVFKIKNDPRITPIGRFLRKTSIDELAPAVQRVERRHEPGGPAAAAGSRLSRLQQGLAAPPFQYSPGDYLPLADQWKKHRPIRQVDGIGHGVHRPMVCVAGHANPYSNHPCSSERVWRGLRFSARLGDGDCFQSLATPSEYMSSESHIPMSAASPLRNAGAHAQQWPADPCGFSATVFRLLDKLDLRYCLLHSPEPRRSIRLSASS